jgi:hypothetical protein
VQKSGKPASTSSDGDVCLRTWRDSTTGQLSVQYGKKCVSLCLSSPAEKSPLGDGPAVDCKRESSVGLSAELWGIKTPWFTVNESGRRCNC